MKKKQKKIYTVKRLTDDRQIFLIEGLTKIMSGTNKSNQFYGGACGLLYPMTGDDEFINLCYVTRRNVESDDMDFADNEDCQKVIFNPLYDSDGNKIRLKADGLYECPFILLDWHDRYIYDEKYRPHNYNAVTFSIYEPYNNKPSNISELLDNYFRPLIIDKHD